MFGHNEVTGQKFFRDAPEARAGKLLVTSVFCTLQGEGPLAGQPAVFVRLAKCQLTCSFCDTYFDTGDWMSPPELHEAMLRSCGQFPAPSLVVVTGGEPTLQAGGVAHFLDYIFPNTKTPFAAVQFESNGMLPFHPIHPTYMRRFVTFVLSPKCKEKDGRPHSYLSPHPLALEQADCLKFVLSGDEASPYHEVPNWARAWASKTGRPIYVSPMAEYNHVPGQTRALYDARRAPGMSARVAAEKISFWEPGLLDTAKCRRNYEYAALYALEHGLRLSIQQHLFASLP